MSEQTIGQIDTFHVEEIVGDHQIACDFSDHSTCPKEAAAWVLHRVRCQCGKSGAVLACTPCKDVRLLSDGAVVCDCGEVFAPAKHAYSFIEPIGRPR